MVIVEIEVMIANVYYVLKQYYLVILVRDHGLVSRPQSCGRFLGLGLISSDFGLGFDLVASGLGLGFDLSLAANGLRSY